jgi:hypothetical protein
MIANIYALILKQFEKSVFGEKARQRVFSNPGALLFAPGFENTLRILILQVISVVESKCFFTLSTAPDHFVF